MIYFDNAATTRVSEHAAKTALTYMTELYANPSSAHGFGFEIINDVHVQLNGYLLARRLLPKGPSFRANRR